MIAAPLFHSWGFAHFMLGISLSSTVVLRRSSTEGRALAARSTSAPRWSSCR